MGVRDRVVVIGAGIGGLAASLRLACAGLDVVTVEAATAPGGKLRAIPSSAGPVEAGPTVLTLRGVFDALFAEAGDDLEARLTLAREPVLARHWWPDGSRLDLFDDPGTSESAVADFAGPRAAAEFRAFHARTARLFAVFDAPVIRAPRPCGRRLMRALAGMPRVLGDIELRRTMAASLARSFRDPRLGQLFGRYATYVGGSPFEAPALLALIWQAEAAGVWRVEGGLHRLAQALADAAAAKGARLLYDAEVRRIETEGGRVAAVRLADGTRLPAGAVVFNGDPAALARGLLGAAAGFAVRPDAVAPRSLSAYVWSFAAAAPAAALAHHNVFFAADPRTEFDDLGRGAMPADPTLYVCACDRGANVPARAVERFEIIMNGAPCPVGAARDAEEQACRRRTFEPLARMGLQFPDPPGPEALATPAWFARRFPGSDGSLYGRSPHGMTATFRRPTVRSAVPGLFLAGGGVHPGAGLPMAALSGRHAAEAILADLASTSRFRRTAMPGGISTASPTTAPKPSRSSGSSGRSSPPGMPGAAGATPRTTAA